MSTRNIILILVGVTAVIMLLGIVLSGDDSLPENSFFENTSMDSLSSMRALLDEYHDELEIPTSLYGEYQTYEQIESTSSYTKEDLLAFSTRNDLYDAAPSTYSFSRIEYILDSISSMICLDYDEGETCRGLFKRKQYVELQMEGNDLYINYYVHHKSSFLYERDVWENFEFYFTRLDGEVYMVLSESTYDMLSGYSSISTYYHHNNMNYEAYHQGCAACNYIYTYIDYETTHFMTFDVLGSRVEITYYDPDEQYFIEYSNDTTYGGFEYHQLDENTMTFFVDTSRNTMRFNLNYVEGWDNLVLDHDDYYRIYNEEDLVTDQELCYIGHYQAITPYLFVEYDTLVDSEELASLAAYNLASDIEYTYMLGKHDLFVYNTASILALYGLYPEQRDNRDLFEEKIIDNDDSHIVN